MFIHEPTSLLIEARYHPDQATVQKGWDPITLGVRTRKDLEEWINWFDEHGVRFETYGGMEGTEFSDDGVATMSMEGVGSMKGVWFKDADGNILALFQKSPVLASV